MGRSWPMAQRHDLTNAVRTSLEEHMLRRVIATAAIGTVLV